MSCEGGSNDPFSFLEINIAVKTLRIIDDKEVLYMKILEILVNYIIKNGIINEVTNAEIDIPIEGGNTIRVKIEHMTTRLEKD